MVKGFLVDGSLMQKKKNNCSYSRCMWCGRFFSPDVVDGELRLFCSSECEKKNDEFWDKKFKNWQKKGGHF